MSQDLLQTGTNELEIIIFTVGKETFAMNVMKVREIIQPIPVTSVPNSHPHVEGLIRLRDEVLSLVDLYKVLGELRAEEATEDKFIVGELNRMKVAFRVEKVSNIHRISWSDIEKPTDLSQGLEGLVTGVVKVDDKLILLLDFEKIVVDINPETGIHPRQIEGVENKNRSTKKLVIAEDSVMLRKLLHDTLTAAGYEKLTFFENGEEAFAYLNHEKEEGTLFDNVDLVITDVEMPQMDGLHLTKKIKQDEVMGNVPVVIFSSLITKDIYFQGESVGADGQISKPEIAQLVKLIDELLHV